MKPNEFLSLHNLRKAEECQELTESVFKKKLNIFVIYVRKEYLVWTERNSSAPFSHKFSLRRKTAQSTKKIKQPNDNNTIKWELNPKNSIFYQIFFLLYIHTKKKIVLKIYTKNLFKKRKISNETSCFTFVKLLSGSKKDRNLSFSSVNNRKL